MTSGTGTYVLVLKSPETGAVEVGKLGRLHLDGGWLLYVGSAFGSGGLRARLARHLRKTKTLHWHVDYLVRDVSVSEIWWTDDDTKREEEWIEILRGLPEARIPLRGFGSGDCGCEGHLVRLPERPGVELIRAGRIRSSGGTDSGYAVHRARPDDVDAD